MGFWTVFIVLAVLVFNLIGEASAKQQTYMLKAKKRLFINSAAVQQI